MSEAFLWNLWSLKFIIGLWRFGVAEALCLVVQVVDIGRIVEQNEFSHLDAVFITTWDEVLLSQSPRFIRQITGNMKSGYWVEHSAQAVG